MPLVGRDVEALCRDPGAVYRELAGIRSCAGSGRRRASFTWPWPRSMNAVWDLVARRAGKPLWQLLAEMSPEALVAATDFRYISDVLTPEQAVEMLREMEPTRAARIEQLRDIGGCPCYTTSAGWLGYSDDKLRRLLQGGRRRRLPARQDEGRVGRRGRHPSAPDRPGRDRLGHRPDDRREPGVGRSGGDRVGFADLPSSDHCGLRSRRVRTTCSVMRRSGGL